MLELVQSGGWLMIPILACSVIALAIIGERLWALQARRVIPRHLVAQVWHLHRNGQLDAERIAQLRRGSMLGRILAAGLVNMHHDREIMKEAIEDTGRQVVHELERYLNALGTIAAITPLLGLLGTVIGMIQVFNAIVTHGVGNPSVLADGISQALITTAAGLSVAIPSLMFYRYFRGRVDDFVVRMEQEALRMIEVMHGEREREGEG
ncbi:MotA/TolQ/ExbB proton channel family protein [Inmirania thermothiophila]|uniref:Biopolymer transport protein ExbB n=1 Tax=Inmirania thermothiophila TaxID=1750597 RepID=A0A3N1Y1E0_9GAMM|nr:MotA/TolQ/ExbB proton channel family protein [Inmirania thermothiophila]ROR32653.1 biopolymer transport protein ExbB [Inmirania thermothiophila]